LYTVVLSANELINLSVFAAMIADVAGALISAVE